ncbi:HAD family hydrolase [Occallatibacter riparius]|uniref:HAD family hydrolase n=1 Tax=Occallatibacter riparius TaxID=1002689 RepID=A0A9J7BSS3_9BACT|nr:HAD family hydrolase [Occallatibacter riparius]UWZ84802.1 HAD family hydrolase [Occallatibacter riparius]
MADVLLTDIDGTLIDSNALHAEAWRRAFEHFGIEIGMDDAWRQIGKGADQLIPTFLPEAQRERIEKPLKEYRKEIFHRDYMPRIVPFARAHDLLVRVREAGMKIALATSSDPEDLKTYGKLLGMEDLVDEASSAGDAKRSKPAPDIFAAALEKMGMRPEQAIALGDTPWDAQAAGKLGIRVVGVTCGGWKRGDLMDAGCVEVWRDPGDLLEHFGESVLGGRE